MILKIICIAVGVLIGYLALMLIDFMDLTKALKVHHNTACTRIDMKETSEDLIVYSDHIIGVTGDSLSMFYRHLSASKAYPGKLIGANPETKEVYEIEVSNFPSEFQINAQGITLFNTNLLYVLSHSYNKGGEIIFIFLLTKKNEKIEAFYQSSIKLGNDHGLYNSLAIIDTQHFFVSQ